MSSVLTHDLEPPVADTVVVNVRPREEGWSFDRTKRVTDSVLGAALLLLFAPFILVAAVLIELTSPGAAFFVQWRVGRRGRLFRMFKLRTMIADAELGTGPVWAQERDPRVTRIGRFLRATHLDELPQLVNVLKGEMSLVGPRPERPLFVSRLTREIPNYSARLEVRPGITGLAQICHGYDKTMADVRRKLAYDLLYIRRMSLLTDLRILVATIRKTWPASAGAAV